MTRAEALAFNAGVLAVVDVAQRSAVSIGATSRRPITESFAIVALDELAMTARALLIVDETEQPILAPERPGEIDR